MNMDTKYGVDRDIPGAIAGSTLTLTTQCFYPVLLDEAGRFVAIADPTFIANAESEGFISMIEGEEFEL